MRNYPVTIKIHPFKNLFARVSIFMNRLSESSSRTSDQGNSTGIVLGSGTFAA